MVVGGGIPMQDPSFQNALGAQGAFLPKRPEVEIRGDQVIVKSMVQNPDGTTVEKTRTFNVLKAGQAIGGLAGKQAILADTKAKMELLFTDVDFVKAWQQETQSKHVDSAKGLQGQAVTILLKEKEAVGVLQKEGKELAKAKCALTASKSSTVAMQALSPKGAGPAIAMPASSKPALPSRATKPVLLTQAHTVANLSSANAPGAAVAAHLAADVAQVAGAHLQVPAAPSNIPTELHETVLPPTVKLVAKGKGNKDEAAPKAPIQVVEGEIAPSKTGTLLESSKTSSALKSTVKATVEESTLVPHGPSRAAPKAPSQAPAQASKQEQVFSILKKREQPEDEIGDVRAGVAKAFQGFGFAPSLEGGCQDYLQAGKSEAASLLNSFKGELAHVKDVNQLVALEGRLIDLYNRDDIEGEPADRLDAIITAIENQITALDISGIVGAEKGKLISESASYPDIVGDTQDAPLARDFFADLPQSSPDLFPELSRDSQVGTPQVAHEKDAGQVGAEKLVAEEALQDSIDEVGVIFENNPVLHSMTRRYMESPSEGTLSEIGAQFTHMAGRTQKTILKELEDLLSEMSVPSVKESLGRLTHALERAQQEAASTSASTEAPVTEVPDMLGKDEPIVSRGAADFSDIFGPASLLPTEVTISNTLSEKENESAVLVSDITRRIFSQIERREREHTSSDRAAAAA